MAINYFIFNYYFSLVIALWKEQHENFAPLAILHLQYLL